ncbi:chorismate mutase [Streptomyces sp. NPDC090045]|uniref:chorismate mutase n=1 Tax=Streptomyces sp. NPDC090045 TaxID=3365927 RepID=UPI0038284CD6
MRAALLALTGAGAAALVACGSSQTGTGPARSSGPSAEQTLGTIVRLAAERVMTADTVAAAKWGTSRPIDDPSREKTVLASAASQAAKLRIDRATVQRIFKDQIAANKDVQRAPRTVAGTPRRPTDPSPRPRYPGPPGPGPRRQPAAHGHPTGPAPVVPPRLRCSDRAGEGDDRPGHESGRHPPQRPRPSPRPHLPGPMTAAGGAAGVRADRALRRRRAAGPGVPAAGSRLPAPDPPRTRQNRATVRNFCPRQGPAVSASLEACPETTWGTRPRSALLTTAGRSPAPWAEPLSTAYGWPGSGTVWAAGWTCGCCRSPP